MSTTIQFTGHLGHDPELRFSEAGVAWVKLRVAVNRRVKRGDEWQDATPTWWDVTADKDLAENVDASLRKSDPITVVGRVITEEYTDKKTGETKTATKVRADQIAVPLAKHTVTIRKASRASEVSPETNKSGTPADNNQGAESA